jgi:FkbM family methyltransferase
MSNINNNTYHAGRLGNQFFLGMAIHFIAKINNLKVVYQMGDKIIDLGIELFSGTKTYDNTIELLDINFFKYLTEPMNKNFSINKDTYFQTKEFSIFLKDYINEDTQKTKIKNSNKFTQRYNENNNVYVHVRLGDVNNKFNSSFEYYDKALQMTAFSDGYISSDSILNPICQKLITKYNLSIIDFDEVETIMFASTCKHIILSTGTFSWMIGVFSFYSDIKYPKIYNVWHGDIFVFPSWTEIDYGLEVSYNSCQSNDDIKIFTNVCDSTVNGEMLFYSKIKHNLHTIFDIGCKSKSEYITFEGNVHYFDPLLSEIETLRKLPNKNTMCSFNNFGLGDENKEQYYYPKYDSFYDRINSCKVSDYENKILLEIRKGIDYIKQNNIKSVDFMKIDTEGYELKVLKGFEDFLQHVKVIQFEYGGTFLDNNTKLINVIEYLREHGFHKFSYVTRTGIRLIDDFNDHYNYCNIVCINKNSMN